MCRRNPQPVKNLGWRVDAILKEANSAVTHSARYHLTKEQNA